MSVAAATLAARSRRHPIDLVTHLVAREFRLRYRRSLFGWLWAMAQPLTRLATLAFVFSRVLPLDVPNYPVFLFTGLIGWSWFSSGVSSATGSVVDRRDLLFRPGLPRAAIPVVSVLADGLDYLAALPVLVLFLLIGPGIPLTALALPLVLVPQFLLTLGLGFALCGANVYLRDVRMLVSVLLQMGFYLTPIFYRPDALPTGLRWITDWNPMARLIDAQRKVLVDGVLPDLRSFLVLTAASAVVCVAGYAIFRRGSPSFVDEL